MLLRLVLPVACALALLTAPSALRANEIADQKDEQRRIQSETDATVRRMQTLLRVLGSGFPSDPLYEPALRRHNAGWRLSLARLKVYLEKNMDGAVPEDAK